MRNQRNIVGRACLCLGFLALHLVMILSAVHTVGTDDALYFRLQMRENILGYAGVTEDDLLRLDEGLAEYLAGDAESLNLEVDVFGVEQPAFNETERVHMADCFDLFQMLRAVQKTAAILGVFAIAMGLWLARGKGVWASWLIGGALLWVPLIALGAWAALDFTAAFNFFHQMLFTNDLWLLNPRTDLLIRICPESMFASMALRIVRGWLISEIRMLLIVFIAWKLVKGQKGKMRDERV